MNPEIKQLWVEALRSGKYRQAHDQLRIKRNYCCLGVLCEIAVRQNVTARTEDGYEGSPWRHS